jgi:hypothetical protein
MEDEKDVNSRSHQRHRTTSARQISSADSANSEDDENADHNEDDLSEGDDDLSGLKSALLQNKISSEVKSFVFLFIHI